MQIRRLDSTDAPAYKALRLQALRESPTAFSSSYEEEHDTPISAIAARLAPDSGRHVFGAFVETQLVGMVVAGRESGLKEKHRGFVRGMYVAASHRGSGIARQLMTEALGVALSMPGLLQVTLSVTAGNDSAIALYRSFGFEAFGVVPGALLVDGVLYDEVQMVRHLAAGPDA